MPVTLPYVTRLRPRIPTQPYWRWFSLSFSFFRVRAHTHAHALDAAGTLVSSRWLYGAAGCVLKTSEQAQKTCGLVDCGAIARACVLPLGLRRCACVGHCVYILVLHDVRYRDTYPPNHFVQQDKADLEDSNVALHVVAIVFLLAGVFCVVPFVSYTFEHCAQRSSSGRGEGRTSVRHIFVWLFCMSVRPL